MIVRLVDINNFSLLFPGTILIISLSTFFSLFNLDKENNPSHQRKT